MIKMVSGAGGESGWGEEKKARTRVRGGWKNAGAGGRGAEWTGAVEGKFRYTSGPVLSRGPPSFQRIFWQRDDARPPRCPTSPPTQAPQPLGPLARASLSTPSSLELPRYRSKW